LNFSIPGGSKSTPNPPLEAPNPLQIHPRKLQNRPREPPGHDLKKNRFPNPSKNLPDTILKSFKEFWRPFWGPKSVKFRAKMRKRRHPKTTRFFHRFFLGLGMVFRRFFKCFFISKCRQTLQSNIAKKLRKHWPWRQNQESAFSKILIFSIILVKNHHFLAISI